MGCENSNGIKDFNKTAPITPNNILFSPSSSTNKENIINKNRRSSQVKINNLRRSIFDKNNNIPNELSHLNNKKKSFSQSPIKNIFNLPQCIKLKNIINESEELNNKEPILDLSNKYKKLSKRKSQLYKKSILIENKNNSNNFNKIFDGKMKHKQKSTPIHFNNSLIDYNKLIQNKSLKNSNDLYSISKDDINPKKIIQQINENNEKKIRRQSLNIKRRNINLDDNIGYKSANNINNIEKDFIDPIILRNSTKKNSVFVNLNQKYTLNDYTNYNNLNENNSFRRKSYKIRLSRKNCNNMNSKDNDYKNPIKYCFNENISLKRKSVSIPKKYFTNDFEDIKNKIHLSEISEVPVVHSLFKEISGFHNLNKELFFDIEKLINNREELYNKFYILISKYYNFNKNSNEEPKYEENIKIRILNKKINNDWNTEPLKTFKNNIENLFKEDKYKIYSDLSFDNKFKEYEKIPKGFKFPLITLYSKFNQAEEIIFDFSKYSNVITIFFFDNSDDSINTLKIISNYYSNNISMFHFVPIYCEHINNIDEAIDIFNNIKNNYNINIGNQEIYFIINNKSKIIKNYFTYYDDIKKTPIIYIIDKNFYIRSITEIKNFNLGMIKNIKQKLDKKNYIEQVNNLIEIFEEQKPINDIYQTRLFFRKAELCEYDNNTGKIYKIKKIYEGLSGRIYGNQKMVFEIQKRVEKNFLNMNQFPQDNQSRNYINNSNTSSKEINSVIKNQTINFSKIVGLNFDELEYIFTYTTEFFSFNNKNYPEEKMKNNKEENLRLEFPLKILAFKKNIHSLLIATLTSVFNNSNIFVDYISCLPLLNQEFPSNFELINPKNKNKKEFIQIINSNELNLILVFGYTNNYLIKCEINYRINKIKNQLNHINLIVIFKGEILQFESMFEDLYSIINNNIKTYIIEPNNNSFPLFIQKSDDLTNENIIYYYLIDYTKKIIYTGNLSNIVKFDELIKPNIIIDDLDSDNNSNELNSLKINHYLIKNITIKEINDILERFEELILNEFEKISYTLYYRPFIRFSYDKIYKPKLGIEKIENIKIYIIIKERHKNIFTCKNDITKLFKILRKEYGALILIIPLECEKITFPLNCEKCKKILNNVPYYYDQEEKNSYCETCEKNLEYKNTHLIFIKSNRIDKEIISDLYNSNIFTNENLEKDVPDYCCICEGELNKEFYISLIHFNIKEGYSPICICKKCFNIINENNLEQLNNLENKKRKELCIHSDNLIFRKIILI